jgi:hypothetical protein
MIYLGHFSFATYGFDTPGGSPTWHGYFTCAAEAASVEKALEKFEALLLRVNRSGNIFTDVKEVYLDACVEIRAVPRRGFLSFFCETRGECQERIATSLAGTSGKNASSYELATTTAAGKGGAFVVEPFLVFPA